MRKIKGVVEFFTVQQVVLLLSTIIYAASIHFAHTGYLAEQHHVPFFNYGTLGFFEWLAIFIFIFICSFFLPNKIENVSGVFVIILYYFLYLPVYVISLGNKRLAVDELSFLLLVVAISFLIIGVASKLITNGLQESAEFLKKILNVFFLLWVVALIFFLLEFNGVMSLVGLDKIYVQRELGKAKTVFAGYLQVYFGYFFSLALFAFGLHFRKGSLLIFGLAGCFLLYLVTAERSIFVLPALVGAIYLAVLSREKFSFWLAAFLCLSAINFVCVELFYKESKFMYDLGFYYLVRVVAIPGGFFEQYYDFFSRVGYTNYSHVSVLNTFMSPDEYFRGDSLYPQLGKIVGRDVHHINSNSNASFIATDGVAAFGLIGLLIVSLVLAFYLFFIDLLSKDWPLTFIAPSMCPLAIVLTNGSLFTVLLSFGGFAWLMLLAASKLKLGLRVSKD